MKRIVMVNVYADLHMLNGDTVRTYIGGHELRAGGKIDELTDYLTEANLLPIMTGLYVHEQTGGIVNEGPFIQDSARHANKGELYRTMVIRREHISWAELIYETEEMEVPE